MDGSAVEASSRDASVIELDHHSGDASQTNNVTVPFPSRSSRRKQTKGGIKLDDTIELDSSKESVDVSERENGDVDGVDPEPSRSSKPTHKAFNGTPSAGPAFKCAVTSTPLAETVRSTAAAAETMGDLQDEMYNSFAEGEEVPEEELELLNGVATDGELSDDENCDDCSTQSYNMTLPSKTKRILDPEMMPETCTLLTAANGGKVYLVGTAHFSHESQEDVAKVIRAVQPDIVLLELCRDRSNILNMDEQHLLEQANDLTVERMIATIRQDGAVQGALHLMMLSMSVHLTKELGMAPGGEFRRAYKEANAIPGCLVHLGDRPIHVTLKRALGSLSPWQKVKLAFNMVTSRESVTKEDVEKCKQKDMLESMMEEMAGEFPSLSRVFVDERDVYMAHSLRLAAEGPWRVTPQCSRGPCQAPVVVGVVGIGHVQGIVKKWSTVKAEDVARVVRVPVPTRAERWAKGAFKAGLMLATVYGGYRVLRSPINRISAFIFKR